MPLIAPFIPPKFGGGIAATATGAKSALTGTQQAAASMVNTITRVMATLSGTQKQSGTVSATMVEPVTAVSDTRPPLLVSPTAALSGAQQQSGVMGATIAKATSALTATQIPVGGINVTVPKLTTSLFGRSDSHVTRDTLTGSLILNGQRYRAAGPNCPDLGLSELANNYGGTVVGGVHLSTHSEIDDVLAEAVAMNATVIRGYSCVSTIGKALSVEPTAGSYNAAALEPVDYALKQCAIFGIRLILPLVDNYQFFVGGKFDYCSLNGVTPDSTASQFFTNTTVINAFKAHISFVLDHVNPYTGIAYKYDPTILCWETGNELGNGESAETWGTNHADWTNTIAAHIKTTKSARQLVMDGHKATDEGGSTDTITLADSLVDIFTSHPYFPASHTSECIRQGDVCKTYGKAFIIGEYSWNGQTPQTFPLLATGWSLTEQLSGFETTSIDGDLFWQLLPTLDNFGGSVNYTLHYPADSSNSAVSQTEMAIRGEQLKNHAALVPTAVTDIWTPKTSGNSAQSGQSRSVTIDTGYWDPKINDIVVLCTSSTVVNTIAVPSGWANPLGANTVVSSDSHTVAMVYHIVTSAEDTANTATYTATNLFNTSATGDTVGLVLRGVDVDDPIDSANSTFSSTDNATPHILASLTGTDLSDDSFVMSFVGQDGGGAGNFYTIPVGYGPIGISNGNQNVVAVQRNGRSSAGVNVPATNITPGIADEYASITVAFKSPLTFDGGDFTGTGTDTYDFGDFTGTGTDTYDGRTL